MHDLYMYAINAEKDLLKIKSLDIVVTEKCSLRCLNCSNLMQYYKNPKDCSLQLLLDSLDKFMQNVDELYEARVLGGEPFLYKELPSVIKKLASYDNCSKIIIFTNGTIVPKDVSYLKDKKVSVMISDYGTLSRNKECLMKLLEEMQIPFVSEKIDTWQDCATIKYRKRSNDELKLIFGNCCVNDTLTLLHGKLYRCPFAANAENLKAIPTNENIDLMMEINLKDKIHKLYLYKDFIQACHYCNGRDFNVERVRVAEQCRGRDFNVEHVKAKEQLSAGDVLC
jgi:organic radical activating enzyme